MKTVAAIPAYNRAHLITETLESVLNQTVPIDSVVVVDDGSSDETADVVERFGARNDWGAISIIRKSNGGVSSARNRALVDLLGTDSIVMFLD